MADKEIQKAPCRVKITKCSYAQGWYKNLIGEEFDTDLASPPKDYIVWEDFIAGHNSSWRHISQEDCERIFPLHIKDFPTSTGTVDFDKAGYVVPPVFGEWQLCPMCHGFGEIRLPETSTPMFGTCPVCNGAKVLARPIINDKNV